MSGKPQGLVGLRAESREVCSCGVLSSSLSKEGRERKGFSGIWCACGAVCRLWIALEGFVWPVDEGTGHISGWSREHQWIE